MGTPHGGDARLSTIWALYRTRRVLRRQGGERRLEGGAEVAVDLDLGQDGVVTYDSMVGSRCGGGGGAGGAAVDGVEDFGDQCGVRRPLRWQGREQLPRAGHREWQDQPVRFGQVKRLLDGCPRRALVAQVLAGERVQQV